MKIFVLAAAAGCLAPACAAQADVPLVTYSWTTTSEGYGTHVDKPSSASFQVALSAVQSGRIDYSDITNIVLTYPGLTFDSATPSSIGLDNAAFVDPVTGAPIYHDDGQGLAVIAFAGFDINNASTMLSITFDSIYSPYGQTLTRVSDQYNALKNYDGYAGFPTSGYWTATFPTITVPTGGVPEPASWAMFIGGFGMIGGAMRGRKRMAAIPA